MASVLSRRAKPLARAEKVNIKCNRTAPARVLS
jgi:hypothetical protein